MNIGELIAYLRVDESELEAGVDRGEERMRRMGGVAAGAGAAAGAALGGGLSMAMTNAINLDSANARLEAALGAGSPLAAAAGEAAGNLYAGAYGESMDEVNTAVQKVAQNVAGMSTASAADLENVTGKMMNLASVMEIDVGQAANAVGQMIRNGMARDATEAMDLLAAGAQNGANRMDDLADVFAEYGETFQTAGLKGAEAMGVTAQAMEAGAWSADLVADAIREFGIIAQANGSASAEVFSSLGLNAGQMAEDVAAGGARSVAALDQTLDALRAMPPGAERSAAAVALFGTKAEEMGDSLFAMDPSTAVAALGQVEGAVTTLDATLGDTAESKVLGLQRSWETMSAGMIATEGPLGMVAAAVAGFGPAALSMAGSLAMIGMAMGPLMLRAAVFTGQMLLTAGTTVLSWGMMAASALASAASVALSWLIAIAPIALVIAAVVGLAYLIYSNWEQISAWTSAAWGSICAFVADAWNNIVGFVQGGVENAKANIMWFASLPLLFGQWFAGVVNIAGAKLGELVGFLGSLPGRALGALGNIGSLLYNSGSALISGFWNGLTARWNQLMAWVRGAMANLRALWPFSPAKEGPFSGSGYVTHSGKALTGDFAASLRKGMPGVVDAARGVMSGAHAALTADMDTRPNGLPGNGWISRAPAGNTSTREGDRVVSVTVNNPIAERASDTLGRRARTLAALGPFAGASR